MGFILHVGATVMCSHGGQAMPTVTNPRVKVSGQFVVNQPMPYTVAGCPFNVSGGPMPCVVGQWVTGAIRVKAGGMPVLLQNSQAITIPNGVPLSVTVVQPRVKGM